MILNCYKQAQKLYESLKMHNIYTKPDVKVFVK